MAQRIIAFDDALEFGGHERMFLKFAPALWAEPHRASLTLVVPQGNAKLASEAATLRELNLIQVPHAKRRGEPYRAPFRRAYRETAETIIREQRPNIAIIVQGRIENTLVPMLVAARLGIPTVSYLPMAHSVAEVKGAGNLLKYLEWTRRYYYRLPSRFIVPSSVTRRQLIRAGAICPIRVVPNIVEAPTLPVSRDQARRALGLPAKNRLALLLGRIDRQQKGHDRLLDVIARARPDCWSFVIVGEGKDSAWLDDEIMARGLSNCVIRRGWTDNPGGYYRACDVALIPSYFEGVPLVALEALNHGLPVIASPLEAHQEMLPREALTTFTKPEEFAKLLDKAVRERDMLFGPAFAAIAPMRDIGRARDLFAKAVFGTGTFDGAD